MQGEGGFPSFFCTMSVPLSAMGTQHIQGGDSRHRHSVEISGLDLIISTTGVSRRTSTSSSISALAMRSDACSATDSTRRGISRRVDGTNESTCY